MGARLSKQRLIYIEGNIGCGKSNLMDWLMHHEKFDLIREPVRLWQDFYDVNLLQCRYYGNKKEMEFLLQLVINLSRMDQISKFGNSKRGTHILMERSIYSAYNIFVAVLFNSYLLDNLERDILMYMKDIFCSGRFGDMIKPDLIIYLRATPKVCMERIQKRDRIEERKITEEYIESLHKAHDYWLRKDENNIGHWDVPCPILELDGDLDEKEYPNLIAKINERISEWENREIKRDTRPKWDLDKAIRIWKAKRDKGEDVIDGQARVPFRNITHLSLNAKLTDTKIEENEDRSLLGQENTVDGREDDVD